MIRVQNLSFSYDDHAPVFDRLSFEIERGKITGLVGRNGSGKSTLFKLLLKLLSPKSGEIWINNRHILEWSITDIARNIAWVPSHFSIQLPITVREVLSFGRFPFLPLNGKLSEMDIKIIQEIVEWMHLGPWLKKTFLSLSSGEKQLVLLAKAFIQKPNFLLLDESVSHLDLEHQQAFSTWIRQKNKEEGLTIFFASHHLSLLQELCHDIHDFSLLRTSC